MRCAGCADGHKAPAFSRPIPRGMSGPCARFRNLTARGSDRYRSSCVAALCWRLFAWSHRRPELRHRPALMLQAGLRVSVVAALRVSDVLMSDRSGSVRIRHGKGIKAREIPLNGNGAARTQAKYLEECNLSGQDKDAALFRQQPRYGDAPCEQSRPSSPALPGVHA